MKVLQFDPSSKEARDELETCAKLLQLKRLDEYDSGSDSYVETDWLHSEAETVVLSESDDFKHEGNGIPCRFYNHDGCNRGSACAYKHAPDNRSIRDKLYVHNHPLSPRGLGFPEGLQEHQLGEYSCLCCVVRESQDRCLRQR